MFEEFKENLIDAFEHVFTETLPGLIAAVLIVLGLAVVVSIIIWIILLFV